MRSFERLNPETTTVQHLRQNGFSAAEVFWTLISSGPAIEYYAFDLLRVYELLLRVVITRRDTIVGPVLATFKITTSKKVFFKNKFKKPFFLKILEMRTT